MKPKNLVCILLLISGSAFSADDDLTLINTVLDEFHSAAARGDKTSYLGLMTSDAVFMGTDEWERWPKTPQFVDYVGSRFKNGTGWTYKSVERNVNVAEPSNVAWFDEVVFSDANGRFRGTGVLVEEDGSWKIAHYAMSFLVFNENWQEVIELSKKTRAEKEAAGE